jgi:succinate-semialdehyde dehydrogenase/glutarate-semialdehyde dehydrogenase
MTMTLPAPAMIDQRLINDLLSIPVVGSTPQYRTVVAPFTGTALYDLPLSAEQDVQAAVDAARQAQREWAARPLRERKRVMLRYHDLVLQHRDQAMDLIQAENGKARRDAMEEVLDVAITARHYARDAHRLLKPQRHRGALPLLVGVREVRHPKGVVGVISPWNYPFTLAASDAIPALLAGNAVVLKPDVQTTLTALFAIRLLRDAGLPAPLIQVVTGEGPEVGPMVIDRVDYVMFTGSTPVGRFVASRCGDRLIGCSLELGGKNALIVRADADPDRAAEIALRACFANSGQLCISAERIYVNESIQDRFLAAFLPRVAQMNLQAGLQWGADMGSLITAKQFERVQEHVDDAVRQGATVLVGGRARPEVGPYFFEPTVLANVDERMTLCETETFGPVAAVYPVSSDAEAVSRANDSPYGLNAAIITRNRAEGRRLAAQIKTGTVNVNEGYAAAWGSTRAPMGGMGDSGIGRRHGDEGLLKYTEAQTIATQRALGFGAPFGWSDRRWGQVLTVSLGAMKRFGLK